MLIRSNVVTYKEEEEMLASTAASINKLVGLNMRFDYIFVKEFLCSGGTRDAAGQQQQFWLIYDEFGEECLR
jgi:hypothetical protein